MPTRGVVYVHSTPLAVCPHVEWAVARALAVPVRLRWSTQPIDPGARRAEFNWTGRPGTGARIATELRQWPMVRFEVTEEPSPGVDGERFMHVPGRGLFRAAIGASGDIQVGENQLRALMASARVPAGAGARAGHGPGHRLGRRPGALPARRRGRPGDRVDARRLTGRAPPARTADRRAPYGGCRSDGLALKLRATLGAETEPRGEMTSERPTERMPTLFLSHGAPPLADDPVWAGELAGWAANLPRPRSILVVSAHWEEAPLTVGATRTVPLVYDFWGFPRRYYEVTLPGAGRAGARRGRRRRCAAPAVHDDPERGLDHGAYVPAARDVPGRGRPRPAGLDADSGPDRAIGGGARLAPLRDDGVLIIGSGFSTHNLRRLDPAASDRATARAGRWSSTTGARTVAAGDVDALLDFERKAPAARLAHPRTEHFAPLFVALGAALDRVDARSTVEGFWYGLSKRSLQFH